MGYPVAYRTKAARASSQRRAPVSQPKPANDNQPWRDPPKPANDNNQVPGRDRPVSPPKPANDNGLLKDFPDPRGLNPRQLRKIRTVVKLIDPVDQVIWSGISTVLNQVPGLMPDIPPSEWGTTNNWRGNLPLAKRWDNRSEIDLQQETAASIPTRLTNQGTTGKPTLQQNVGAGQYLSTYHIYWVGSPLFTWRRDETADYGPAPANIVARNRVVNMGSDGVPLLPLPRPLPHILLPLKRPSGWPQDWAGGYHKPSPLNPSPSPDPVAPPAPQPRPRPRPRPRPEPRPEPSVPPLKPWPPTPKPDPLPWWPPVIGPRPEPGTDPHPPPAPPPTTRPPMTPRRPPGPRVKERKTKASQGMMNLINFLGDVSEWKDIEDAFYDALPEHLKDKRDDALEKAKKLYQHWNEVDLDTALFNAAFDQIADRVWALLGVKYPGRYGGAIGANKILSKAYGQQVADYIKKVHDHVADILNRLTGTTIGAGA